MKVSVRGEQEVIKVSLAISIAVSTYIYLLIGDSAYFSLVFSVSIFLVYFLMKPVYILNPANMVAAFSILFFVLPFLIDRFYEIYNVPYILPWGRLWDWQNLDRKTYGEALGIFFILFFSFCILNQDKKAFNFPEYHVRSPLLVLIVTITFFSVLIFINQTGGLNNWIYDYKKTYLLGRQGNGALNFFNIMMGSLSVFLLGLKYRESSGLKKISTFLISIFLIAVVAYVQGLKSRLLVLFIIFWASYLFSSKFTWPKIILFSMLFIILMFFLTYVRSDGFYSSPIIFLEYTMTYFNVYPLHDLIVKTGELSWFSTTHQLLAKPAEILGFPKLDEFDLNVMLTKEYFPNDWARMKATQQWPLITDLRFNYFGFWGGWFPLLLYVGFLVYLYKMAKGGSVAFLLIFVLEFVRLFSVLRGTLIPWQIFVYVPMYIFSYLVVKSAVRVRKYKED